MDECQMDCIAIHNYTYINIIHYIYIDHHFGKRLKILIQSDLNFPHSAQEWLPMMKNCKSFSFLGR